MKKQLSTAVAILGSLMIVETANAVPVYSGTCQDVGFNDSG